MDRRELGQALIGFMSGLGMADAKVEEIESDSHQRHFVLRLAVVLVDPDEETVARIVTKWNRYWQGKMDPVPTLLVLGPEMDLQEVPATQCRYFLAERLGDYTYQFGCQTADEMRRFLAAKKAKDWTKF